jgi:GPH family glycoside/pentoside/hexuronide:cation symporter
MLLAAASCRAPEFGARLKASPSMTTIFPKLDRLAFAMAAIAILTGFAMPMFSQMMLYIATYLIGRPMFASQVLTAVCIGQFAGVLLWTLLVRRFEKTTLLGAGHALNMAGVLAFAFAGSSSPLMLGSAGLIGVGLASVYMLPWGLLADVVDFAEYRHRQRREAALFAVFLVIIKASGVASVSFVGWAMAKMHYIPGVTQSAAFHSGVQLLAYGIPFLGSLLAILLMMALPISHHRHAVILRQLNRRKRCSEPQFKPIA